MRVLSLILFSFWLPMSLTRLLTALLLVTGFCFPTQESSEVYFRVVFCRGSGFGNKLTLLSVWNQCPALACVHAVKCCRVAMGRGALAWKDH